MPRRKASRSGTTKSRYERVPKSRRVVQRQPANAERRLHAREDIVGKAIRRSRDSLVPLGSRSRRALRHDRVGNRRSYLQARADAPRRLQKSSLPMATTDANAHRNQMPATPCARKKSARRAVIIATGYGGINKAKQYRRHKPCR